MFSVPVAAILEGAVLSALACSSRLDFLKMPVGVLGLLGCCCKRTRIPQSDIAAAAIALRSRNISDASREDAEAAPALSLDGVDRNFASLSGRITPTPAQTSVPAAALAASSSSPSIQPSSCSDRRGSTSETCDGHTGTRSSSSGGSRRSVVRQPGDRSEAFSLLTLEEALRNHHHYRAKEDSRVSLGEGRRDSSGEAGSPGLTSDSSSSNGNATPLSLDGDEEAELLPGTPTTASSPFSRKTQRPHVTDRFADSKRASSGSEREGHCERDGVGGDGGFEASHPALFHSDSGHSLEDPAETCSLQQGSLLSGGVPSQDFVKKNQDEAVASLQEEKEATDEEERAGREKDIYEVGSDSVSCSRAVSDHFAVPQFSSGSLSVRLPSPTAASRNTSGLTEVPGGEKDIWISKSPLASSSAEVEGGDTGPVAAVSSSADGEQAHTGAASFPPPEVPAGAFFCHASKEDGGAAIRTK